MAKNIVVYIFAFVLLLAIALGCVTIFKIGKGISDSFDTLFETDTQTDSGTNSDTGTSTESETVTDAITPHTVKLGDSGLQVCATNNDKNQAMLGVRTFDLKAHTKYRVTWTIDASVFSDMNGSLPIFFETNSDGKYVVPYLEDWRKIQESGRKFIVFNSQTELCNNTGGFEFVSSELGSEFSLYFFSMPFESTESTIAAKSYVTQYITDFAITEVLE